MPDFRCCRAIWSSLLVGVGLRAQAQELRMVRVDSIHEIRQLVSFPSKYVDARNIDLYLPPDYDTSRTYRLLIMQDGQNLFCPAHAYQNEVLGLDRCLERNRISDVIVAGVWNTKKRFREYLPGALYDALHRKDRRLISREYGGSPLGDDYLKFLIQELLPYLRREYPVSDNPQDVIIGGISMGALISFYAAVSRPDVFGSSMCLSTHWPLSVIRNKHSIPESYLPVIRPLINSNLGGKYYFDRGDENIDAWYEDSQKTLDAWMKSALSDPEHQMMSRLWRGQGHAMKDWFSRVDEPVRFILLKQ